MAKKNREINITNDNIKGLDIKNGGKEWYKAQGKTTHKDVKELVGKIIPIWSKIGLSYEEMVIGLSIINMESGYNIYASNKPKTYKFNLEEVQLHKLKHNINNTINELKEKYLIEIGENANSYNSSNRFLNCQIKSEVFSYAIP